MINSIKTSQPYEHLKREAFVIGFKVFSKHLFGLPERTSQFLLNSTDLTDPYRLYNVDLFPHEEWNNQSLYSSLPYITAHSKHHDESIMIYNTAEMWIDIFEDTKNNLKE